MYHHRVMTPVGVSSLKLSPGERRFVTSLNLDKLHSVPMGESLVVWSEHTREIRLLNPIARWMFDSTREGFSEQAIADMMCEEFELAPETARADVQRFVDDLTRSLGPEPEIPMPDEIEGTHAFTDQFPAETFHLEISGLRIDLILRVKKTRRWHRAFSHLLVDTDTRPDHTLEVGEIKNGDKAILVDGENWYAVERLRQAVPIAYHFIRDMAMNSRSWFSVLHGAAVSLDGVPVLMPGRGYQGKTTFCAALTINGGRYFSDDVVPLSADDGEIMVHPLPTPLCVRIGSWPVLESLGVDTDSWPDFFRNGMHMRFMTIDKTQVAEVSPANSAVFIVPIYDADKKLEVRELSDIEIFQCMISGGSSLGPVIDRQRMTRMLDLIASRPAIEIRYSDTMGAIEAARQFARDSKSAG